MYQRALKLLYVDELLARVKQEFTQQYKPDQVLTSVCCPIECCSLSVSNCTIGCCILQFKYPQFEESFRQMLKDAENSADLTKGSVQSAGRTRVTQLFC